MDYFHSRLYSQYPTAPRPPHPQEQSSFEGHHRSPSNSTLFSPAEKDIGEAAQAYYPTENSRSGGGNVPLPTTDSSEHTTPLSGGASDEELQVLQSKAGHITGGELHCSAEHAKTSSLNSISSSAPPEEEEEEGDTKHHHNSRRETVKDLSRTSIFTGDTDSHPLRNEEGPGSGSMYIPDPSTFSDSGAVSTKRRLPHLFSSHGLIHAASQSSASQGSPTQDRNSTTNYSKRPVATRVADVVQYEGLVEERGGGAEEAKEDTTSEETAGLFHPPQRRPSEQTTTTILLSETSPVMPASKRFVRRTDDSARRNEENRVGNGGSSSSSSSSDMNHSEALPVQQQQQSTASAYADSNAVAGTSPATTMHSSLSSVQRSATASIPYEPPSRQPDASPALEAPHSSELAQSATPPSVQQQPQQQQQQPVSEDDVDDDPALPLIDGPRAIRAIVAITELFCKANEAAAIPSSDFHSYCVPPMSVEMYVQRIARHCVCSSEALLCGFILLLKYTTQSGHPMNIYNAHRLLITSTVIGIKLRDDTYYSNAYYALIGGISKSEMCKLELLFLEKLEWDAVVSKAEYMALLDVIEQLHVDKSDHTAYLEAFATEHRDKVEAYAAKESSKTSATVYTIPGATTSCPSSPKTSSATNTSKSESVGSFSSAHVLGAYRAHQWKSIVVPWLLSVHHGSLAKHAQNRAESELLLAEEGRRWEQYRADDAAAAAAAAAGAQSPDVWVSPQTVRHVAHGHHYGTHQPHSSEPPYRPQVAKQFGVGVNGNAAAAGGGPLSRYPNYPAMPVGGYFGHPPLSTMSASPSGPVPRATTSSAVEPHGNRPSHRTAPPAPYHYSERHATRGGSHAAEWTPAPSQQPSDVGFGIHNRVASAKAVSVTGSVASPQSSTTPGSGINVNAQPYYYVRGKPRGKAAVEPCGGEPRRDPQARDDKESSSSLSAPACYPPSTLTSSDASMPHSSSNSAGQNTTLRYVNWGNGAPVSSAAANAFPSRPLQSTASTPQSRVGTKRPKPDAYLDY